MTAKKEFTTYRSRKLAGYLDKEFANAFERTCVTNIPDPDSDLKEYGQEEADTGMVLHVIDVCKRDPFTVLTISCSDTNVLLILLNYFDQLPCTTTFKTTHYRYNLRSIYDKFTHQYAQLHLDFML